MEDNQSFRLLNKYVGKEYILSFIVSFMFFFFIFFINQILVLAQKIMIKNVRIQDVLLLVTLAIPQFLMYTMPFSSLASASMVIGNLSSQNEIMAMRSNGIKTTKVFFPVVVLSLIMSLITFLIADKMIPFTALQYRQLYAKTLQSVPTLELESFSSTQFDKRVISNGLVKDNIIHDIMIFDDTDSKNSKIISAKKAEISVIDLNKFLYKIELDNPEILITDSTSLETFSLAKADHLTLNIDLSSSGNTSTKITPSQMSLSQLRKEILVRASEKIELEFAYHLNIGKESKRIGDSLVKIESIPNNDKNTFEKINNSINEIKDSKDNKPFSFFFQYYRSELQKKYALSLACTCLVFLAFPLSFFKVKYGRLVGFGLSMFCACIYWFFLYYMHIKSVGTYIDPILFLWLPNTSFFVIGLLMIRILNRR